jgi:aryl-alcohol dehydrogenase-like predicted oxidoreductase
MKTRQLGNTDLQVSEVGFGTWTIATNWWGQADDASDMLKAAFDSGITFYDTAPAYGDNGLGESIMAPFIAEHKDEIIVTTKCGYDIHAERPKEHSERPHSWSRESIVAQTEESLTRLGLETIDLMQLHNLRIDAVRNDELWETLQMLVDQGKIRYLGVALGPAIGWEQEGIESLDSRNIVSLQTVYNLLEQEPGRTFAKHKACTSGRVSQMARVPHASDALSGKVTRDSLDEMLKSGDHRSYRVKDNMLDNLDKADTLDYLWAPETGRSIGQAAIAGILAEQSFATVFPTCLTVDEVRHYAAGNDNPLSDDEAQRMWDLYANNFGIENRFDMELRSSDEK